jgi:hypothetical protein
LESVERSREEGLHGSSYCACGEAGGEGGRRIDALGGPGGGLVEEAEGLEIGCVEGGADGGVGEERREELIGEEGPALSLHCTIEKRGGGHSPGPRLSGTNVRVDCSCIALCRGEKRYQMERLTAGGIPCNYDGKSERRLVVR